VRADVRKSVSDTLERLYKLEPSAKQKIGNTAGYAVFSNFGMKIFFAGGVKGSGGAFNNRNARKSS